MSGQRMSLSSAIAVYGQRQTARAADLLTAAAVLSTNDFSAMAEHLREIASRR